MPLPNGLSTVTVTGTFLHPDGTPLKGALAFVPEPAILTSATHGTLLLGTATVLLSDTGTFTVTLLATDDPDITPVGWTYRVTERCYDAPGRSYPIALPAAAPTVDLADIAPTAPAVGEYTVVTGPQGAPGAQGPEGDAGEQGPPGTPADMSRVTALEEAMPGKADTDGDTFTGDVTVQGANLTVMRADGEGAYRLRVTGGGLDLEVGGMDVNVAVWDEPDFNGGQHNVMRWEAAGPHLIGRTQFGTGPFDTVHDIDAGTGVAGLGAKNGLTNVRLAGFKNSAGAPTSGVWSAGDVVLDSAGAWHLCTAAGSPGTWT
jgi:hypothetical protein